MSISRIERPSNARAILLIALLLVFLPLFSASTGEPSDQEILCNAPVVINDGDALLGKDRAGCKTSLSKDQNESYDALDKMYKTLPDDNDMEAMGIKRNSNSRVEEEERNVTVRHAFLYAYKYEKKGDHDFHLIIGTKKERILLTAECSALPVEGAEDYQALLKVRKNFKCFINQNPGEINRSWRFYNPPIRIEISGSLFYDVDHAPGAVGPQGHRPDTSWEIHPLSDIRFFR